MKECITCAPADLDPIVDIHALYYDEIDDDIAADRLSDGEPLGGPHDHMELSELVAYAPANTGFDEAVSIRALYAMRMKIAPCVDPDLYREGMLVIAMHYEFADSDPFTMCMRGELRRE